MIFFVIYILGVIVFNLWEHDINKGKEKFVKDFFISITNV